MDLSKKVFGSNVDQNIIEYFDQLGNSSFEIQPGDPVLKKPIGVSFDSETYLGDRTPYARMWTAINIRQKVSDVLKNGGNYVYSINENRVDSYGELDSMEIKKRDALQLKSDVNYRSQLDSNPYLKPTAGITSINSKSEGAIGALRRTTVNFTVHNIHDFETIFLPFFLKPGATVFVDFGYSDKNLSLYNPEKMINNANLEMNDFYEEIYKDDGDIGRGFKTTLSGQVTKYDVNVDDKGSFNCNLEFVSSNYSLLDKSISDDNNLKFIFNNSMEELLMGIFLKSMDVKIDGDLGMRKLDGETKNKLIKDFFDADKEPNTIGSIGKDAKRTGIFYQNLSGEVNDDDKLNKKESLYISYGLFEDKFLNNFISFWEITDDDGKVVERLKSDEPFSNSFSSQNSYVRWDEHLDIMQNLEYQDGDDRISFLYPNSWGNTYNKLKPKGSQKDNTKDDKEKRRIPLRELFISVPLISEAFEKSTNVNDALEFIFDKIKEDSGDIINIKMAANNDGQSSITFIDVNVQADIGKSITEKELKFDLTSGNTVVLNSDLKFETPKAGLSSMIAIGNLKKPTIFGQSELDKFNLMNSLDKDKKYQVRHLPIQGEHPSVHKALSVNMEKLIKSTKKVNVSNDFYLDSESKENSKTRFNQFVKDRKTEIEKLKEKPPPTESSDENKIDKEDNLPTVDNKGNKIIYAKSKRHAQLLVAKIHNFLRSTEYGISPVMPITLSLKVYGNNFLGIGDFFTVNFLPKHYQDRVFFQIVGVDHSLNTTLWETTYTTVMRLRSTEVYKAYGNKPKDEIGITVTNHPTFSKKIVSEINDSNGDTDIQNDGIPLITDKTKHIRKSKQEYNHGDLPDSVSRDDIPTITFEYDEIVLDPNLNSEKMKKLKKENDGFFDKGVFNDRWCMQVTRPSRLDAGSLAYYMVISNLLLGDDVIDWEGYNKDAHPHNKPQFQARDKKLILKRTNLNRIYAIPRLTPGLTRTLGINPRFGDFIFEPLDDYVDVWYETDRFLDEFQEKINLQIEHLEKTQKLSSHIKPITGTFEGFYFLDTIVWKIEDEGTKFLNIRLGLHKDLNLLSNIFLPIKYMKMSYGDFEKRLHKEYITQKAAWNTFFSEYETPSDPIKTIADDPEAGFVG